jgi:hypothetical protein
MRLIAGGTALASKAIRPSDPSDPSDPIGPIRYPISRSDSTPVSDLRPPARPRGLRPRTMFVITRSGEKEPCRYDTQLSRRCKRRAHCAAAALTRSRTASPVWRMACTNLWSRCAGGGPAGKPGFENGYRARQVLVAQKVTAGVYKGVTTTELDELAAETAAGMTSHHPDYAVVRPFFASDSLLAHAACLPPSARRGAAPPGRPSSWVLLRRRSAARARLAAAGSARARSPHACRHV